MKRRSSTMHGDRYDPKLCVTSESEQRRADMGVSQSMRGLQQIASSRIRPEEQLQRLFNVIHAAESAIMDLHFIIDDEVTYPVLDAESLDGYWPDDNLFYTHREMLQEIASRHTDFGNSLKEHVDG